ncbi:MAG: hypothetical protein ACREHE_00185 [Rhizomicrobium sp.]
MAMVLRFISLVLIVIGLMLLGADTVTSLEKDQITVRSLAQMWTMIDPGSLAAFKAWLEHTLPGFLAGGIEAVLNVWSWVLFGMLGVTLAFTFSRQGESDYT